MNRIAPSDLETAQAWKEAFEALLAYSNNNSGENSIRNTEARKRLDELGLRKRTVHKRSKKKEETRSE